MPATQVVVLERRGLIGARIASCGLDAPYRLRETRSMDAFGAALADAPFPVAIVERDAAGDQLAELLDRASDRHAATVVVASALNEAEQVEILERGATAISLTRIWN